jgi:hypothetical protein
VPPEDKDRIEVLCSKVVSAANEEELAAAVSELRRELHEHIDRLRNIATPQVPLLFLDRDDKDAA